VWNVGWLLSTSVASPADSNLGQPSTLLLGQMCEFSSVWTLAPKVCIFCKVTKSSCIRESWSICHPPKHTLPHLGEAQLTWMRWTELLILSKGRAWS
jgi:hypothetical protein